MIDALEIQRASSIPFSYIRTNIKNHKIYVSIPKIGTEIKIGEHKVRTDKHNRIVVSGAAGELYLQREEVVRLLCGYETSDGEKLVYEQALLNQGANSGKIFNEKVIKANTKVVNGVPIMDWLELHPSKVTCSTELWCFFVPKEVCFNIIGSYSDEWSGEGDYIVCDSKYNAPYFPSKRIVRGKIFDACYARSRAFDKIPYNLGEKFETPRPKNWISKDSTQGVIATFKIYNDKLFSNIKDIDYVSRGYNIADTDANSDRLVTNLFILKKYNIYGESYITKDRKLVYRVIRKEKNKVHKGNLDLDIRNFDKQQEFEFSVDGFNRALQFVTGIVNKLRENDREEEFIANYTFELMSVFDSWCERLKTYDKHKVITFINDNEIISNTSTIKRVSFECYKECNSQYAVGAISGGIISLEKKNNKFYFLLTLIINDQAIDFVDECNSKGIKHLTDVYVNTLLK